MGVRTLVRFHFPDGSTISEPLSRLAMGNRTDLNGARELIKQWVADGDLKERPDGGYDVINHKPRKMLRG